RISVIAVRAASVSLSTACSCRRNTKELDAADLLGQKHAALLCDTILSDHELHYRLLNVRSREWQMRSNGFNEAADRYIASFETYISEHNSELAAKIF
ncbi:MAG: hypothetical protein K2L90_10805, partial [Muribaculaceae bacterium]|nr:hypothetical protein [Muribaculaceae bacterium]